MSVTGGVPLPSFGETRPGVWGRLPPQQSPPIPPAPVAPVPPTVLLAPPTHAPSPQSDKEKTAAELIAESQAAAKAAHIEHLASAEELRLANEAALRVPIGEKAPAAPPPRQAAGTLVSQERMTPERAAEFLQNMRDSPELQTPDGLERARAEWAEDLGDKHGDHKLELFDIRRRELEKSGGRIPKETTDAEGFKSAADAQKAADALPTGAQVERFLDEKLFEKQQDGTWREVGDANHPFAFHETISGGTLAGGRIVRVGSAESGPLPERQVTTPQAEGQKPPERGLPESATDADLLSDMTQAGREFLEQVKAKPDEFSAVNATDLSPADRRNLARLGVSFVTDRQNRILGTWPAIKRAQALRQSVQAGPAVPEPTERLQDDLEALNYQRESGTVDWLSEPLVRFASKFIPANVLPGSGAWRAWLYGWKIAREGRYAEPSHDPQVNAMGGGVLRNVYDGFKAAQEEAAPAVPEPAKPAEETAKEPWEMTRAEYATRAGARPDWVASGYGEVGKAHKRGVENALAANKPVPAEVLAEYGLKPSTTAAPVDKPAAKPQSFRDRVESGEIKRGTILSVDDEPTFGKTSDGNWGVRYEVASVLGTGRQQTSEQFFRKADAQARIVEIKKQLSAAAPVAEVKVESPSDFAAKLDGYPMAERNKIQQTIENDPGNPKLDAWKKEWLRVNEIRKAVKAKQQRERPRDILDDIRDNFSGPLSLTSARKFNSDFKPSGAASKMFRSAGHNLDSILDGLHREGLHRRIETESDLLDAITEAARQRSAKTPPVVIPPEIQAQEAVTAEFKKAAVTGIKPGPRKAFPAVDLKEGDTFEIKGETFTVKAIDSETGEITVDGGRKFGRQYLQDNKPFYPDKGIVRPEEPLFGKVESDLELKMRLEAKAKRDKLDAQAEEVRRRGAAPLTGSSADVGQGKLFAQDKDLFSGKTEQEIAEEKALAAEQQLGLPQGKYPLNKSGDDLKLKEEIQREFSDLLNGISPAISPASSKALAKALSPVAGKKLRQRPAELAADVGRAAGQILPEEQSAKLANQIVDRIAQIDRERDLLISKHRQHAADSPIGIELLAQISRLDGKIDALENIYRHLRTGESIVLRGPTEPGVSPSLSVSAAPARPGNPRMVRNVAIPIVSKWKGAPEIVYGEVPGHPLAEGGIVGGKLYLNPAMLPDAEAVRRVLFHEAVGHVGVEAVVGPKFFDYVVKRMKGRGGLVKEWTWIKENYPEEQWGKEVMAQLSEGKIVDPGLWQTVKARVMQFARRMGFSGAITDAEVRVALRDALRAVEKGEARGEETLLSKSRDTAQPFYSRIIRTVEQSSQANVSGAQWKAIIRNAGVKQDEYDLVSVKDLEDNKTYTKQEVLDYLKTNEVVVKDVTLGEEPGQATLNARLQRAAEDLFGMSFENLNGEERLRASKAAALATTHFSTYQLPGAKEGSYREVLLTVPKVNNNKSIRVYDRNTHEVIARFKTGLEAEAFIQARDPKMEQFEYEENAGGWRDGHSQYADTPNPIVRIRLNERTTADGKRMLFLEEVQAPQKGEFEKMPALFQKNWREIAFKWALRKASEEGYDSIGWTPGTHQAERYDLSKHFDTIEAFRYADGKYSIRAHGPTPMEHDGVKAKDLERYVGKDLAEKIINQKERTIYSGLDLKVGGEGLKKLYDVDFRNVVNNLPAVKKAGQKVGTAEISEAVHGNVYTGQFDLIGTPEAEAPKTAVHALSLTPAIRESVMGGQALFSKKREYDPDKEVFSAKNVETNALRNRIGLEDIEKQGRMADEVVWDAAKERLASDPLSADEVMARVKNKEALTATDQMILVQEMIKAKQYWNLATEKINSKTADDDISVYRFSSDASEKRLGELTEALDRAGTITAQSLAIRRALAQMDYSEASLVARMRADNDGKPLSDQQHREIRKMADDYAEASAKADAAVAKAEFENRAEYEKAEDILLDELVKKEASQKGKYDELISRFKKLNVDSDKQARAKFNTETWYEGALSIPRKALLSEPRPGAVGKLRPSILKSLAEVGATWRAESRNFEEWADAMRADIGARIEPHLQEVWEASGPALDAKIKRFFTLADRKVLQEIGRKGKPDTKEIVLAKIGAKVEAEKEKNAASKTPLPEDALREKTLKELSYYAQKLYKIAAHAGVKGREPRLASVHADLKEILPDITPSETRDAVSRYGDYKLATKDEIDRSIAQDKGEMQALAKIEGMEATPGIGPKPTGQQRVPMSHENRRLIKIVNNLKRKGDYVVRDPESALRSALQARETYYTNRLSDLRAEIAAGELTLKKRAAPPTSPELEAMKAELELVKAEHEAIFKTKDLTPEQRLERAIKAAERSEAQANTTLERARKGDFSGKKPVLPLPPSAKLEAIKARADAAREETKLLKALDQAPQKAAERLEREKAALEKSIAEIIRKVTEGDLKGPGQRMNRPGLPGLEELLQKRDAANRLLKEARKKPEAQKAAEQLRRRLNALNKAIDERLSKVAAGDVSPLGEKPKVNRPMMPELEIARQQLDAVNEQLRYLRHPPRTPQEIALQAYKTRLANRLVQMTGKLARGDYTTTPRQPLVLDAEALDAKAHLQKVVSQWEQARYRDKLAKRTQLQKVWGGIRQTKNAFVNIMSAYDVSAPRQMFLALLANSSRLAQSPLGLMTGRIPGPKESARLMFMPLGRMFQALMSEKTSQRLEQWRQTRPNATSGADKIAGIQYTDLHTMEFTKWEENAHSVLDEWAQLPLKTGHAAQTITTAPFKVGAKGVRASNRAFITALNTQRAMLFDHLLETNFKDRQPTKSDLEVLGNLVNVSTGRGKLGRGVAKAASEVLWSPSLFASRLQVLIGQPLWGGGPLAGSARARWIVAKEYARWIVSGAALLAISRQFDDKKEGDLTSSDAGKIVRGNTRIDVWEGFQQHVVLVARLKTGRSKSSDTGAVRNISKFGTGEVIWNFFKNKTRPDIAAIVKVTVAALDSGKPAKEVRVTLGDAAKSVVPVPLSLQDIIKVMKDQGLGEGAIIQTLSTFGVGVNTYDDREKQK